MERGCFLVATDDFYAQESRDLGFLKNQEVEFLGFVDENWGHGQLENRRGIFPLAFTKIAPKRAVIAEKLPLLPPQNTPLSNGNNGNLMLKYSSEKPNVNTSPFALGVIRKENVILVTQGATVGENCSILAQNELGAWWIKCANHEGKYLKLKL
jgi:hypothetical protein